MFTLLKTFLAAASPSQNLPKVANAKFANKAAHTSLVHTGSAGSNSQEEDVSWLFHPSYADRAHRRRRQQVHLEVHALFLCLQCAEINHP